MAEVVEQPLPVVVVEQPLPVVAAEVPVVLQAVGPEQVVEQ